MPARRYLRKSPHRAQRSRILALSEGKRTEPQYLKAIRSQLRIPEQNLRILTPPDIPNTPREMVAAAKKLARAAKEPFDEIWCIFDTEAKVTQACRDGIREALIAAKDSRILIAGSNPCFEIWLVLHRVDHRAWIDSASAQRKCEELGITFGNDGKQIQNAEELIRDHYQNARTNARNLDLMHERDGRTRLEDMNPSSGVYRLTDSILAAFSRENVTGQ
jgi:RloB-like protein